MKKKTKKILAIGAGIATGGLLVCGIHKQWKKGVFNYNIMKDACKGREPSYREVQLLKTGAYLMADASSHQSGISLQWNTLSFILTVR